MKKKKKKKKTVKRRTRRGRLYPFIQSTRGEGKSWEKRRVHATRVDVRPRRGKKKKGGRRKKGEAVCQWHLIRLTIKENQEKNEEEKIKRNCGNVIVLPLF